MSEVGEVVRPDDFSEVLESIRSMRDEGHRGFDDTIQQLRNVLDGTDTEGLREQYYSGWSDDDIRALVAECEKERDVALGRHMLEVNGVRYSVTLEAVPEECGVDAYVFAIPGLMASGETPQKALEDMEVAIRLWFEEVNEL